MERNAGGARHGFDMEVKLSLPISGEFTGRAESFDASRWLLDNLDEVKRQLADGVVNLGGEELTVDWVDVQATEDLTRPVCVTTRGLPWPEDDSTGTDVIYDPSLFGGADPALWPEKDLECHLVPGCGWEGRTCAVVMPSAPYLGDAAQTRDLAAAIRGSYDGMGRPLNRYRPWLAPRGMRAVPVADGSGDVLVLEGAMASAPFPSVEARSGGALSRALGEAFARFRERIGGLGAKAAGLCPIPASGVWVGDWQVVPVRGESRIPCTVAPTSDRVEADAWEAGASGRIREGMRVPMPLVMAGAGLPLVLVRARGSEEFHGPWPMSAFQGPVAQGRLMSLDVSPGPDGAGMTAADAGRVASVIREYVSWADEALPERRAFLDATDRGISAVDLVRVSEAADRVATEAERADLEQTVTVPVEADAGLDQQIELSATPYGNEGSEPWGYDVNAGYAEGPGDGAGAIHSYGADGGDISQTRDMSSQVGGIDEVGRGLVVAGVVALSSARAVSLAEAVGRDSAHLGAADVLSGAMRASLDNGSSGVPTIGQDGPSHSRGPRP